MSSKCIVMSVVTCIYIILYVYYIYIMGQVCKSSSLHLRQHYHSHFLLHARVIQIT